MNAAGVEYCPASAPDNTKLHVSVVIAFGAVYVNVIAAVDDPGKFNIELLTLPPALQLIVAVTPVVAGPINGANDMVELVVPCNNVADGPVNDQPLAD